MPPLETLAVLLPLSPPSLTRLRTLFPTVHYHPDFTLPLPIRANVDMVFTSSRGLPGDVSLSQVPRLRHVQLASAGADGALKSPAIREIRDDGAPVTVSSASGTHVLSIPPWVVGMAVVLYHQVQSMVRFGTTQKRWAEGNEVDLRGEPYVARSLRGRTAGMLGYGALGRESARLLKAHGMRIVAANTSGRGTSAAEYVIPGTGDIDGTIPEKFYSTKDAESFDAFLRETDVLVCSLPSTPATRYLLNKDKLALLKPDALFINVGRGDLVSSDDLLAALSAKDGLFGAALDVTDPEPLTEGHALWTHPRVVVTPHLSGNTEGEYDIATDIAVANAERVREGKTPWNVLDLNKGY